MSPADAANGPTPGPTGLLVIDKQPGFTSMDVCAIVRTRLRRGGAPKRVKVGHGGTLDPAATGVLVVLVGKATRLCDVIMAGEKEYEAVIDLSRVSTTDDAEGDLREIPVSTPPTPGQLEDALKQFVGDIDQVPPDFSAIHVGGKRAYDIARAGNDVKLEPRRVTVHEVRLIDYQWPIARVHIRCGKGVYIRSIARDLGAALKTGGMLQGLRRTRVGRFDLSGAVHVKSLPESLTAPDLIPLPPDLAATPLDG